MKLLLYLTLMIIFLVIGQGLTSSSLPKATPLLKIAMVVTTIVMLGQVILARRYYEPQDPDHYFEPVVIHFEPRVIRIPLEDRTDLNIGDPHNVHNKTIKRTATMAIEALQQADRHVYSIELAVAQIDSHLVAGPPIYQC